MPENFRKIVTATDEVWVEGGRALDPPWRRVAVAAVLRNPWFAAGYVEDLQPVVAEVGPELARELSERVLGALGGPDRVEAFGKAALVGTAGDTEHGAALIHTPYFGNLYREATEGTSVLPFSDRRAGAGEDLVVPMWHKTRSGTRSHYQTFELRIPDAPRPDEIVVAVAAASGPRPRARIGDRSTDKVSAGTGAIA